MADRLLVAYKTPLQRFLEIAFIVSVALGAAALWQHTLPSISASYIIVVMLLAGFAAVPRIGNAIAVKRGAALMTRDERNRRYLNELQPVSIDPRFPSFGEMPRPAHIRRQTIRPRRRS